MKLATFKNCFRLACLFFISIGLFSCSMTIEKRHYRKGYHVDMVKNNNRKKSVVKEEDQVKIFNAETEKLETNVSFEPQEQTIPKVSTSQDKNIHLSTKKKATPTIQDRIKRSRVDCDVIRLRDGTIIEAVIDNIGETTVTYRKCNYTSGPLYSVSVLKIDVIELGNGDFFRPKTDNIYSLNNRPSHQSNGIGEMVTGILAFIFALFAFVMSFLTGVSYGGAAIIAWVFGTIGFITGIVGTVISAASMNPENQTRTTIGIALSALAILFFMVVVVILVL